MISYIHPSPIGRLRITGDGLYITGCDFVDDADPATHTHLDIPDGAIAQCVKELDAYFSGTLTDFTVPLKATGTPFRERVWEQLRKIPYGATISYRRLAEYIDHPKGIRAVGGANHHNPIVIIIPCHRVIGTDGGLTGYGGGLQRKRFLLDLEQRFKRFEPETTN